MKGLYKKARAGEIKEFTGISAPYEAPTEARADSRPAGHTVDESVVELIAYLEKQGHLSA